MREKSFVKLLIMVLSLLCLVSCASTSVKNTEVEDTEAKNDTQSEYDEYWEDSIGDRVNSM